MTAKEFAWIKRLEIATKRRIFRGPRKGEYKEAPLYYGFHSLRHFMASHLADQERTGLKAISGLLRHKNLKTTEIYLHSIDESQRTAMVGIEGKFTRKNSNSHPGVTPRRSEKSPLHSSPLKTVS